MVPCFSRTIKGVGDPARIATFPLDAFSMLTILRMPLAKMYTVYIRSTIKRVHTHSVCMTSRAVLVRTWDSSAPAVDNNARQWLLAGR
jgi:hypothetical protein